jgi:hypothetical protein
MRGRSLCRFLLVLSCKQQAASAHRVELRKVGGELVELVPLEGTPPNCLAFSISESGVVRQLTMNPENTSLACAPGRPMGEGPFRIPAREGKVRIYVLFADRPLEAQPIAEQIHELSGKPDLGVLDLRAPGRIVTDMVEFAPEAGR